MNTLSARKIRKSLNLLGAYREVLDRRNAKRKEIRREVQENKVDEQAT